MGRVTIFTRPDVDECQQAEEALEKLQIPYKTICLVRWPERNEDLLSLTGSTLVPAVFFNDLFVGGLSGLLNEIVAWYGSQYETPRKGYDAQVKAKKSPSDARLRLPPTKAESFSMMIPAATNQTPFDAPDQFPEGFPNPATVWTDVNDLGRDEGLIRPSSSSDDKKKKKKKNKNGNSKKKTKEHRKTKSLSPTRSVATPNSGQENPSLAPTAATESRISRDTSDVDWNLVEASVHTFPPPPSLAPTAATESRISRDTSFVDENRVESSIHTFPPAFPRSMSSRSQKSSSAQTFPPSSQRNLIWPREMAMVGTTKIASFDADGESVVGSLHRSMIRRLSSSQPRSRPIMRSSDSISTITEATSIGQATVRSTVALPNGSQVSIMMMTESLKSMLPCEDLKYNLTLYKKCFRVKDAIECFESTYDEINCEADAIAFGRALQRAGIIRHVVDDKKPFQAGDFYFRLWCYHNPGILNCYRRHGEMFYGNPMELVTYIFELLAKVETDSTTLVDLVDFRRASSSFYFPLLEDTLCLLQGLDLGALKEGARLATTINLYNIMVRFAFMKVGVPTTRAARNHFFSDVKTNIGGDILSFNDLEHGILRANRAPPGVSAGPCFGSKDPRARLALKSVDHRIHFALNVNPTTATPTPLNPDTIQADLHQAAKLYMSKYTNIMIDSSNNVVQLNQIFQWYRSDFADGNHRLWPALLLRYLDVVKQAQMKAIMKSGKSASFEFNDFDWGTNAGNFHQFATGDLRVSEKKII